MPGDALARARMFCRIRQRRATLLGDLGEPAWHMLLDLFIAEDEGTLVSVSSLCVASGGTPTTAMRWLRAMAKDGLIERTADRRDARRVYVSMTPATRQKLAALLSETRMAGQRRATRADAACEG